MKKIILLITFVIYCGLLSAQTGTGWSQQRAKVNFKDSTYYTKDVRFKVPIKILGATSGVVTIQAPAIAGTTTQTLPLSTGTLINSADTATMLVPYIHAHDTSNMLAPYIQRSDTSGMLTNYITINESESLIQDSIQRNAISSHDYYIYESAGTIYAIPHPKTSYTTKADTNLTTVLQHCFDQLTGGGKIYIAEGTYDHMDTIVVKYDYTQVFGAGMYKTILKAKALIDNDIAESSSGHHGFMQVLCKDYFKLADIQLDGNGDNQKWIDNNNSGDGMVGKSTGLNIGVRYAGDGACTDSSSYAIVENCYIHSWAGPGGIVLYSKNATIRNSRLVNNFSNGITVHGKNNLVDGCYFEGSGDVGCTLYGVRNKIINCEAYNMNGTKGTTGSQWAFGVEGTHHSAIYGNSIINCKVYGYFKNGIYSYYNALGTKISGNEILDGNYSGCIGIGVYGGYGQEINNNNIHDFTTAGTGILCTNDTLTSVIGNKVIGLNTANSYGISMSGSYLTSVISNDVRTSGGGAGLYVNTDNCFLIGNNAYGVSGISVTAGSSSNKIMNNILAGSSSSLDIYDLDSTNYYMGNYGVALGTILNTTATYNRAVTATATGATTGRLSPGSQNITVTSASANNIVRLPVASSSTIGTKITGQVGANGFELRVDPDQAASVYLNNVTTSVEAAIPANHSFEVLQIDATHWILKAWDAEGSIIAGIVPDSI